jgi:hypothetical protein
MKQYLSGGGQVFDNSSQYFRSEFKKTGEAPANKWSALHGGRLKSGTR